MLIPQILFVISSIILAKDGHKLSKYLLKPAVENKLVTTILTTVIIHLVIMLAVLATYLIDVITDPPNNAFIWTLWLLFIIPSAFLLVAEIILITLGASFKKNY